MGFFTWIREIGAKRQMRRGSNYRELKEETGQVNRIRQQLDNFINSDGTFDSEKLKVKLGSKFFKGLTKDHGDILRSLLRAAKRLLHFAKFKKRNAYQIALISARHVHKILTRAVVSAKNSFKQAQNEVLKDLREIQDSINNAEIKIAKLEVARFKVQSAKGKDLRKSGLDLEKLLNNADAALNEVSKLMKKQIKAKTSVTSFKKYLEYSSNPQEEIKSMEEIGEETKAELEKIYKNQDAIRIAIKNNQIITDQHISITKKVIESLKQKWDNKIKEFANQKFSGIEAPFIVDDDVIKLAELVITQFDLTVSELFRLATLADDLTIEALIDKSPKMANRLNDIVNTTHRLEGLRRKARRIA